MKNILLFYIKYFFYWILIQAFFRLLFLIFYPGLAGRIGFSDELLIFYHALPLDLSLTGYVVALPTLALVALSGSRSSSLPVFLKTYTIIILIPLVLGNVTNIVLYDYWNTPLDRSLFDYMNTPGDMVSSIPIGSLVLLLIICAALVYGFGGPGYRYLFRSHWTNYKPSWKYSLVFFFILGVLVIPMRGGFGMPINTGVGYFHRVPFANHATINPLWNLVYTMIGSENTDFTFHVMPDEKSGEIIRQVYNSQADSTVPVINPGANVIIIMLESFTQTMIMHKEGDLEITPEFNRLIPEGIFFSNFYASGTMTDRGLGSIISGYPSLSKTCIFRYERKLQGLTFLSRDLKSQDYSSLFIYGGDIDFAHIRSYVVTAGFDRILTNSDFPLDIKRSNWGVPDEYVLERLLEECNQAEQPFFHYCVTLSSHAPFDVPMEPVFKETSRKMSFYNSVRYTDGCLGDFFRKAKLSNWWQNSIIILVADHGSRICSDVEYDRDRFQIPMLWLGGAVTEPGSVIRKFGSQNDLPVTLLHQLGIEPSDYHYSKDLTNPSVQSFAVYAYPSGFGIVNDSTYAVYHYPTKKFLDDQDFKLTGDTIVGMAHTQNVVTDFLNR